MRKHHSGNGLSKSKKHNKEATSKEKGALAFSEGRFEDAIAWFTAALHEYTPTHLNNRIHQTQTTHSIAMAALYSNRSAAYAAKMDFHAALEDAKQCIHMRPEWTKGYVRQGYAYEGMMHVQKAHEAYTEAYNRDPNDTNVAAAIARLDSMLDELRIAHIQITQQQKNKPQMEQFEKMLKWLIDGNSRFPLLVIQHYDQEDRGVHALIRIPENKVILEVPFTHIMTSDIARESEIGKKIAPLDRELNSTHTYLAAFLLQERQNPNSFWTPYIQTLPQQYNNMPIFFDLEELSWLRGSFTVRKIIDRQEELRDEYDKLCAHVPDFQRFTHDEFVWARLVVITRIFGLLIRGRKTDGLVAMADMLNHRRPRDTSWTFDDARDAFTITTLRSIDRAEQIYDSYGRKCNSRFFVNYGFVLEDNAEDNTAVMFVSLSNDDPQIAIKLRLLGGVSNNGRRRFQVPMNYAEKNSKELFSFLRFACARDSEFLILSSDDRFDVKDVQPISVRNEIEVLKAISKAAKESLLLFPRSLDDDRRLLNNDKELNNLSTNIRNCLLMTKSEKEVLVYYRDLLSIVEPLTKLSWKDFKRQSQKFVSGKDFVDRYVSETIIPLIKGI